MPPPARPAINWAKIDFVKERPKVQVGLRLDADIVEFFRAEAPDGYQSKINAVLRSFVNHAKEEKRYGGAIPEPKPKGRPRGRPGNRGGEGHA